MKKRALSPVIASVLLIAISLTLAVIIFFWARSFQSEYLSKNGREISLECQDVGFDAESFPSSVNEIRLRAVNIGNVPIYGFEIRKKDNVLGETNYIQELTKTLKAGETEEFSLSDEIQEGNEIKVIPILLGEGRNARKPFVCSDEAGLTLIVSEI